ncbi:UDP-N-acetylenolpyruvoylglucosamine reductase [Caenispirillum salinarum AK4]|uniref:UDP-N-acetylenolpyruvoylglucosamine reductase n=1 Tax=Caenispirillum salinarum AK4 TaxID=1238182 RepID=K9GYY5_9PROT|nr:UDP-N-acetylmuramate dehydrogenase [Caenispirillum salinarum]EKV29994.1 UDP-N-acetylenolpyruvoylglucosamine reductase [Caenispirillum salinarum AK4]
MTLDPRRTAATAVPDTALARRLGDGLARVRGRVSAGADLARITWFRVGGPAELMIRPVDVDDLAVVLAAKPADVPLTVIGVGSNLLVRDGGIPGITVRLGRGFAEIEAEDGCFIRAGAAALDANVAKVARDHGIAGLEFLTGVPGTMGGALRMNAGAYGREIKDVLVTAEALDPAGRLHTLRPEDMDLSYRHCGVPEDWVFVAATLKGEPGDPDAIAARLDEIRSQREDSQPIRTRTGGSTFANPDGHSAWKLVDAAGCRGLTIGGAQVSEKHTNFLINTGTATAADLEALGEEVRKRVRETSGVELRWEIRRVGVPADHPDAVAATDTSETGDDA